MYIKDVEPIRCVGINLLENDNPEERIDKIIEEPLKKACKIFLRKGIKTVMSSANRENIVSIGEKPKYKKDVLGYNPLYYPNPTFEDAGVGHAWVMLDFDSLSNENKEILLRLEERKDSEENAIGEEAVWFVHPVEIGSIEHQMMTGKFDLMSHQIEISADEEIPEVKEVDQRYVDFEKKAIILGYSNRYPMNTVIIRRPINDETTVEEVERYFCNIAEQLKEQKKIDKEQSEVETEER